MKITIGSLFTLFVLNIHGAFAIDRLGVEMSTIGIALKLEKGKEIPDEFIQELFELLEPLDQLDKENDNPKYKETKNRDSIVKSWEEYIISITEEEKHRVIEDFAKSVLRLSIEDNVSSRVLERGLNIISQEYYKSF